MKEVPGYGPNRLSRRTVLAQVNTSLWLILSETPLLKLSAGM